MHPQIEQPAMKVSMAMATYNGSSSFRAESNTDNEPLLDSSRV